MSTRALALVLFSAACLLAQAPAPTVAVNGASYVHPEFPNSAIAQGAIFVVFGTNLGPIALTRPIGLPLPRELAGTSVRVTVGSVTADAPLVYVSSGQLAAVMPSKIPPGDGEIKVTYRDAAGSIPVRVVQSNFGLFTIPKFGAGPVVATLPDYSVISVLHSAQPGDTVTLWGTGLGPIEGDDADAPAALNRAESVKVYLGERLARVDYAGRAPCCPGLDQINFVIPAGVDGCGVPVSVEAGAFTSNFPSLAVAPSGGVCRSSTSYWYADAIQQLAAREEIHMGALTLDRVANSSGPVTDVLDFAHGSFFPQTRDRLVLAGDSSPSLGSCRMVNRVSLLNLPGLDAGPQIDLASPVGERSMQLQPYNPNLYVTPGKYSGIYTSQLGAGTFLNSGSLSIRAGGGSDVGSFSLEINLPPPFVWTNLSTITRIDRSQPLKITWTGGDPNGIVEIVGYSTTASGSYTGVQCTAPTAAGQFTIASKYLQNLPVSAPGGFLNIVGLTSYSAFQKFSAPGLDSAFMGSSATINNRRASFQ